MEEPPRPPELTLPPLPAVPDADRRRLSQGPRVVLHEIRVVGSTVFSAAQLEAVTAPYLGRPVGTEELHELRRKLTRLYVDAGYRTSGAVLPDQDVSGGLVEYRIVEGRLAGIELSGNRYFRDRYLRERLEWGSRPPLSVPRLQRELQILQEDPRVRRVNASLGPGPRRGEAILRAHFEEEIPYRAELEFSNHEPPSIGSFRTRLQLAHENLTSNGDVLEAGASLTDGLEDFDASYEIPVNRRDTTLGIRYEHSESDVVEDPFDELDIRTESDTFGLVVRQPVYRSLHHRIELGLHAEHRESETFLLGDPFSFAEGPDAGRSELTILRFVQDWTFRDLTQVAAARSTLSVGLDLLGATVNGGRSVPDGQFLSWLGQFQWVRRFDPWGVQLVARTDLQLASSPLLSLEQFAVGGYATVRGYRENQLVRDDGLVSSVEVRIPLWSDVADRPQVQLASFFDVGRSWNTDRGEAEPRTLCSTGVGLLLHFTRYVHAEIYWAEELRDVFTPDDRDLQDTGVHFALRLEY